MNISTNNIARGHDGHKTVVCKKTEKNLHTSKSSLSFGPQKTGENPAVLSLLKISLRLVGDRSKVSEAALE
jgi:hypothetical protein